MLVIDNVMELKNGCYLYFREYLWILLYDKSTVFIFFGIVGKIVI